MIDFTKRELLILAFDHRTTFTKKMLGIKERSLTFEEKTQISDCKKIIFGGFKTALERGVPREIAGLLVDEEFGSDVLREAKDKGFTFAMPVEKSGMDEFDFEFGNEFREHIEEFDPVLVKVLVRYNPQSDKTVNRRQLQKLKILNDYLHSKNKPFLFELLVPPTEEQLAKLHDSKEIYDTEMRPKLMVSAMKEIQEAGIEPSVWKLEGVERVEHAKATVEQAQSEGQKAAVITLGRGESKEQVQKWLKVGAKTPGIIGFAVGRTIFWEPLIEYQAEKIGREAAVEKVAQNYLDLTNLWLREREKTSRVMNAWGGV